MSDNEISFIKRRGLNVFKSCDFISNYPADLWLIIKAFVGG